VSIFSPGSIAHYENYNDNDSTEESDHKYNSEHDSDVDISMENYVDTQNGIEFDGDVDMARDGDNEAVKDDVGDDQ
jgi:hypothetical protein